MSNTTEDGPLEALPEWSVILFDIVMVAILIVGVAGNGLIILVEAFNKQRTSTDWLVVTLSANDVLVAGFNTCVYMMMYNGNWHNLGSDALCKLNTFIQDTFSYCSTLLLSVTAIDRYLKTCRPHAKGITTDRSKWICFVVVLVSIIIGMPILYTQNFHVRYICKFSGSSEWRVYTYYVVLLVQISFVVMFVIVIVCYIKIAYVIRSKLRRTGVTVELSTANRVAPRSTKASASITYISGRDVTRLTDLAERDETCTNTEKIPRRQDANTKAGCEDEISSGMNPLCSDEIYLRRETVEAVEETTVSGATSHAHSYNLDVPDRKHAVAGNRTGKSQTPKQELKGILQSQTTSRQNKINRTTMIMFAVTLVFLLSWIPPWFVAASYQNNFSTNAGDRIIIMFSRRTFIINTVTNPLFFIGMSSNFRALTKSVLQKIWKKVRCRIPT